jgi:hypothetical protein
MNIKEASYVEKCCALEAYFPNIIAEVKKEIKNDLLKSNKAFCKAHFAGKNIKSLTTEELAATYWGVVTDGDEESAEFIITRWILRHTDVYNFFAQKLQTLTTDFEALDALDDDFSTALIEESVPLFGAENTYLFAIFNSVVFSATIYERLASSALEEKSSSEHTQHEEEELRSCEQLKKRHDREISRLTERYEKKLSGMQKKYLQDTDKLKKTVATLREKTMESLSQ